TDESTTDLVFSGHSVFSLNGELLAENEKLLDNDYLLSVDIDLGKIKSERVRTTVFKDSVSLYGKHQTVRYVKIDTEAKESDARLLSVSASPFIPESKDERAGYLGAIFDMQTEALKRRLELTGALPVVGVSGGLDSTLALLVAVNAVKRMGKSASDVHGITMPCFGTSGRTYNNSVELMKKLGVTYREISIKDAVLSHFKDIEHDPEVLDLTYENAQARERTQVLMDYAGKVGGLVVGTGDLSELALGWCTYNADHMSMYGVNAGVPKTVVRGVIEWLIESHEFESVNSLLTDVLDTPISPELLPPDKSGDISQVTQDLVGPYELHDFYIYYVIRYGFEPEKIFDLANVAFGYKYDRETLKKWLKSFYKRFFTQQFKRSCQPDGVKVERISLSPRGDFRMPSDASARLWLDEVEKL
ncbi:MAG: NAD(+) synthase, partial [Clostridia bacterium]|nr:NAD(+) synthase [Clostridia bacterium]